MPAPAGQGSAESAAGSLVQVSHVGQGPNDLSHHLLPPRMSMSGKLKSVVALGLESRYSSVGCGRPDWGLNSWDKCPLFVWIRL